MVRGVSTSNPRLQRWNERYLRGGGALAPAPLLRQALEGVAPGVALDLACGLGRHALHLAELGWQVVAVDGAEVAVARLRGEAQQRGLAQRVRAEVADLEAEPPGFLVEPGGYDLICDFFYLHRPLLEAIRQGLRAGGRLCAEIHLVDPGAARPMAAEFLLRPGELGALVRGWGWTVLHEVEGRGPEDEHGRAAVQLVAQAPRL